MSTRTVLLEASGYHIKIVGDGDVGSSSAASLVFRTTFDETWDGMGIIAKFTDAAAQTVTEVTITEPTCTLNTDGSWDIPMPHEATAYDGNALLSFVGVLIDEDAWIADAKKTEGSGITGVTFTEGGKDAFAEAVGEVGVYEFSYSSGWLLNGESVTLDEYGLSVTGSASDGDKFIVDLRHPVLKKQTTKPLSFRVYASETERNGDNTEPITATDKEQMLAAAQLAKDWAGGAAGEQPSSTNNAKYYSGLAAASATAAATSETNAATSAQSAANQAAAANTARQQAFTARDEARAAKTAAEAAQGAAEQAKTNAAASATTASTAAVSAGNQAAQALTARQQAFEARNDARDARDEAQAAQAAAEAAQSAAETAQEGAETAETNAVAAQTAAETAQGIAEGAATDAESAQSAAETAQSAAETAESGAVAAQGAAETAQAAAEAAAAAAEAHKYDAFVTDGATAITRFRTTLGADAIPVKTATVTQTDGDVPQNWVIRRCGQNLLNADMIFLRKSSVSGTNGLQLYNGSETQRALALSEEYIPITPGSRLVTRGLTNTVGINVMYYAAFYAADKSFISRYIPPDARIDWATTAPATAAFVRICVPIQYVSTITEKTGKLLSSYPVQLEIHSNPSATIADATPWKAYNGEDTIVTVTALDAPTAPDTLPTTVFEQNTFSLFPQGALTDANPATAIDLISAAATMDVTYRLDPTLAYNQLKAAIVAAGS